MTEVRFQAKPTGKPVVLMTGASGLIGTRLEHALKPKYEIVGLDINPPEEDETIKNWVETDLTDDESVEESLQAVRDRYGTNLASVIHLAAYYDFSGEPSSMYDELTVQGTRRLLLALQDFQVEQFMFSSSLLVMEPCEIGEKINEQSPTQAEWDYPQSKLDAERVIRETRGDVPSVVLRIAGVYDDECHSIPIARQIARIYEEQMESYVFPGDSDAGNAYVHVDDLAEFVRLLVDRRNELPAEECFLVAEPEVLSYAELQNQLGELIHGEKWPSIRIPKAVAKAGAWTKEKLASDDDDKPFIKPWMIDLADDHYAVDMSHARQSVGWQPKRRLATRLKHMVASLKANPQRWYQRQRLAVPEEVK